MEYTGASTKPWHWRVNELGEKIPIAWTLVVEADDPNLSRHYLYDARVVKPHETAYRAVNLQDSSVSFFLHNTKNENGYGGRVYDLNMSDGSVETIKGPWSGSAKAINTIFAHCTPAIDCHFRFSEFDSRSGALLVNKAKLLVDMYLPDWQIFETKLHNWGLEPK